jgi:hypothetical protein
MHKFTGVFNGTTMSSPIETMSSTTAIIWPCLVSNNSALTDPVYDQGTGKIFVGSLFGTLKEVDATIGGGTGGIIKTAQIGVTGGNFDGPLLDSTNGLLYLVVSDSMPSTGQTSGVSAVYTFSTAFVAGTSGVQTVLSNDGPEPISTAVLLTTSGFWVAGDTCTSARLLLAPATTSPPCTKSLYQPPAFWAP